MSTAKRENLVGKHCNINLDKGACDLFMCEDDVFGLDMKANGHTLSMFGHPANKLTNKTTKETDKMTENIVQVLSVREVIFGKGTPDERKMFQVYASDDTGAVGSVYSSKRIEPGELVSLGLSVNRDGKFTAKIMG